MPVTPLIPNPAQLVDFTECFWNDVAKAQNARARERNNNAKLFPTSGLYIAATELSSIPQKEAKAAMDSYAKISRSDERILLLYHKQLLWGAAWGLCLTNYTLYLSDGGPKRQFADIEDMPTVSFDKDGFTCGGKSFKSDLYLHKFRAFTTLNEYFKRLPNLHFQHSYQHNIERILNPGSLHPVLCFLDDKAGEGSAFVDTDKLARVSEDLIFKLADDLRSDEKIVSYGADFVFTNFRVLYDSKQIELKPNCCVRLHRHSKHKHSHTPHALEHVVKHASNLNVFMLGLSLLDNIIPEYVFDIYIENSGHLESLASAISSVDAQHVVAAARSAAVSVAITE